MRMQTTYIDRTNTNEKVRAETNKRIGEGGGTKEIHKFSTIYNVTKVKLFRQLITAGSGDPARTSTLTNTLEPLNFPNKRIGRPKIKWANDAARLCWEQIRNSLGANYHGAPYDATSQLHRDLIRQEAIRHLQTETD